MTKANIGIVGYGPLGMSLVDGVARHEHLSLAGVFEQEPLRIRVLKDLGIPYCDQALADWAAKCDLVLATQSTTADIPTPVLYGPAVADDIPALPLAGVQAWASASRMPCADGIALQRLLTVLGPVKRLFSSCARRTGTATDHRFARVDALEPLFHPTQEDADLQTQLHSLVESIYIRRTRVPYTCSHVHHLKIDLPAELEAPTLLQGLQATPRIRVASGFANTGQLQEYDRDMGSHRGDRYELFVWQETIDIVHHSLFMTVDVAPDTTPVPEMLDFACRFAQPTLSEEMVTLSTDLALELGVHA